MVKGEDLMSDKRQKKASSRKKSRIKPAGSEKNVRQDLPDKDSIIEEKEFNSPKGHRYKIIVTSEKDPYEEFESKQNGD